MKTAMCGIVAAGMALGAAVAPGQSLVFRSSYPLEAPEPIRIFEESDMRLPGRGGPGADPTAARVEIRAVRFGDTGKVKPATDGTSDDDANPLVWTTRIGAGVMGAQPGRFSVCLPRWALTNASPETIQYPTPDNFKGFFARVYDGPTVAESSYYIDSEEVAYNPSQMFTNLTFKGAMRSISQEDDVDSDNDGLTDRLELEYGTNYKNPDSDGDGILDGVEVAYGLDPKSPLAITAISPKNDDPAISAIPGITESEWHVEWPASTDPDVTYKLQLVYDVSDFAKIGDGEFEGYDEMVVKGPITQTNWAQDITEWVKQLELQRGFLRLTLELPPLTGEGE